VDSAGSTSFYLRKKEKSKNVERDEIKDECSLRSDVGEALVRDPSKRLIQDLMGKTLAEKTGFGKKEKGELLVVAIHRHALPTKGQGQVLTSLR